MKLNRKLLNLVSIIMPVSYTHLTNLAFSSNGVDYNFFKTYDKNSQFEPEFLDILKKKKPIIMYYGALAKWFDYELIKKLAQTFC